MATTDDEPIFIDTNVLVYAAVKTAPHHRAARRTLLTRFDKGTALWISRQVLREYLVTVTRPQTYSKPVPLADALADVREFAAFLRVADDNQAVSDHLFALLGRFHVVGKQVHDTNIVATMQACGIRRLLTHNVADFARFSSVIEVVPLVATAVG
jgi:predicted nucleic acid-binding protein